jgi:ribosomal protein L21E
MQRFGIILIMVAFVVSIAVWGNIGGGGDTAEGNGGNSVPSYTFTIDSAAGGAVAVNNSTMPGKATFLFGAGATVSLNAVPDSGYRFVKWSGDLGTVDGVHDSEVIITVNGNCSILARFEIPPPVRYRLAILSAPGGSVTAPGKGTYVYDEGTLVDLVATPAKGYKFARWSGNVDTVADVNGASTDITMNGDYYICAYFQEERTCG